MKILKSRFHNSVWKSKKTNISYEVKNLPISELWGSVPIVYNLYDRPFRKNLKEDIEKNGLINPLLTVLTKKSELIEKKKKYKDRINDLPFAIDTDNLNEKIYVIWGGSQRLDIAKEMGFTHIDCAMVPTLDEAHRLQSEMRSAYKSLLYSPKKNKS